MKANNRRAGLIVLLLVIVLQALVYTAVTLHQQKQRSKDLIEKASYDYPYKKTR